MAPETTEKTAAGGAPTVIPVTVAVPEFLQGPLKKVDGLVAGLPPQVQDVIGQVSTGTGVQKSLVVVAACLLPVLLLLFMFGAADLIVNLVGFVWPALESFKAIEAKPEGDSTPARRWLSYWIVYGALSIAETLLFFVVDMVPYYPIVKMAFLVYCYHPRSNGATMIYEKVLKPLVVSKVLKAHSE